MFAITGITGQVGGEVARNLLAGRQPVRGVVRDVNKAKVWAERGCELVAADINDAAALRLHSKGSMGYSSWCLPISIRRPIFRKHAQ